MSVAQGATLYVDDDESGTNTAGTMTMASTNTLYIYPSINDAMAVAGSGDSIHIYDGVYTETLDISKSLVIEGDSRAGVVIDCAGITGYGIDASDNVIYRPDTVLDWNSCNDPDSDGGSLIANSEIQFAVLKWKIQTPM
ncbi:hypothetical protein [Methanococcoides sp. NM1]|uniref:hypothetical protein n=1 Tax=Methanococcoides sp. NM1 TaxID=1201013 RepID=UPI001083D180|nr:hypothetical protein [Methanococcoides sp. NM1]